MRLSIFQAEIWFNFVLINVGDDCSSDPCLHNGTCKTGFNGVGYNCSCSAGFTGAVCQTGRQFD